MKTDVLNNETKINGDDITSVTEDSGTPKVSVIIPTHNRWELLCRAIESVQNQSYGDIEIIVVDDNSGDQTITELPKLCASTPSLSFIRNEKGIGAAAGRNKALKVAKGDYVCFLDDDDEWLPEKLAKQLPLVEQYSIVGCLSRRVDGYTFANVIALDSTKIRGKVDLSEEFKQVTLNDVFFNNGRLSPSCVMIKKEYLLAVGGFDESLVASQGRDLFVRLINKFGNAVLINQQLANHYQRHGKVRITSSPNHVIGGWTEFNKNKHLMPTHLAQWRLFALCLKEAKFANKFLVKVKWIAKALTHFRFWRLKAHAKVFLSHLFLE